MQWRRLSVANEKPISVLGAHRPDRFLLLLCRRSANRAVGQRRDAHAVGDIESPAMITASDGIGTGEFASADGKWDAAMGATVLQSKTFAFIPDEEQILSEDLQPDRSPPSLRDNIAGTNSCEIPAQPRR
jgi:hypothetical protein